MKYLPIYFSAADNPFLLSFSLNLKQFRLSKVCVKYIKNTIQPHMSPLKIKSNISIERKESKKKKKSKKIKFQQKTPTQYPI